MSGLPKGGPGLPHRTHAFAPLYSLRPVLIALWATAVPSTQGHSIHCYVLAWCVQGVRVKTDTHSRAEQCGLSGYTTFGMGV